MDNDHAFQFLDTVKGIEAPFALAPSFIVDATFVESDAAFEVFKVDA